MQPTLGERIAVAQAGDVVLQEIIEGVLQGKQPNFKLKDGVLRFRSRLCDPDVPMLKEISREAHTTSYYVLPSSTKMYRALCENF